MGFDAYDGTTGGLSPEKVAEILERTKHWPPERKKAVKNYLEAAAVRENIKKRYDSPAAIAAAVDPDFRRTPAINLISNAIERGPLAGRRRNLIVSMPPQEGKSTLCAVWTPIRAWQLNPNRRIIIATYGEDLALQHSTACRGWLEQHGAGVTDPLTGAVVEDKLGLRISTKSRRMDSWRIDGARGGLTAVGLGGSITGRPADLFIIDDPYKNMMEADSETHREKVDDWMRTVAKTRLSPEASMILIQTRWHKDDLAGRTIEAERALPKEFRSWKLINIPAISQEGIEDALNRPYGEAMVSARGRDKREFEQTQREVGQRFWLAMYQGSPTDPEGGLFSRSWFNPKVEELPQYPVAAVVGIDPADSGEGDDTGIIGGILTGTGDIILTKDRSGLMTSDKWAREGVILALEMGAREIVIEGYAVFKTYRNVVIGAWNDIAQECREKLARDEPLEPWERRALVPSMPFLITKYDETGDAEGRASLLRKDFERKRAKVVVYEMAEFEEQAGDWQTGQHCPDRVSAAVVTHWRLNKLGAGRVEYGHPLQQRNLNAPPSRLTRRISDPRPGSPFRGGRFGR